MTASLIRNPKKAKKERFVMLRRTYDIAVGADKTLRLLNFFKWAKNKSEYSILHNIYMGTTNA